MQKQKIEEKLCDDNKTKKIVDDLVSSELEFRNNIRQFIATFNRLIELPSVLKEDKVLLKFHLQPYEALAAYEFTDGNVHQRLNLCSGDTKENKAFLSPFMSAISHQAAFEKMLTRLLDENTLFSNELKKSFKNRQSLSSFIAMPSQRLPEYEKFCCQLRAAAPKDKAASDLTAYLKCINLRVSNIMAMAGVVERIQHELEELNARKGLPKCFHVPGSPIPETIKKIHHIQREFSDARKIDPKYFPLIINRITHMLNDLKHEIIKHKGVNFFSEANKVDKINKLLQYFLLCAHAQQVHKALEKMQSSPTLGKDFNASRLRECKDLLQPFVEMQHQEMKLKEVSECYQKLTSIMRSLPETLKESDIGIKLLTINSIVERLDKGPPLISRL